MSEGSRVLHDANGVTIHPLLVVTRNSYYLVVTLLAIVIFGRLFLQLLHRVL